MVWIWPARVLEVALAAKDDNGKWTEQAATVTLDPREARILDIFIHGRGRLRRMRDENEGVTADFCIWIDRQVRSLSVRNGELVAGEMNDLEAAVRPSDPGGSAT